VTDVALSLFERELMQRSLKQRWPSVEIFQNQIENCAVLKRTWTKVGSFTDLQVDRSAKSVKGIVGDNPVDGDVHIWVPGLTVPAGHVIFMDEDGYLSQLEVFTYSSPPDAEWPEVPVEWKFIEPNVEIVGSENPFTH
jgi:hypothetical protein